MRLALLLAPLALTAALAGCASDPAPTGNEAARVEPPQLLLVELRGLT